MPTACKRLDPNHPGEILLEDLKRPMSISINRLARDVVVPPGRISAIVNSKRAITADTARRTPRPGTARRSSASPDPGVHALSGISRRAGAWTSTGTRPGR